MKDLYNFKKINEMIHARKWIQFQEWQKKAIIKLKRINTYKLYLN